METKTETDLIISKTDVLVKQRIGIKPTTSGPRLIKYEYPIPIRSVKARDKIGPLKVKKINFNTISIEIKKNLEKSKVYAFELSMLVTPDVSEIGEIKIYNWGSLDLYRVITLIPPFKVLGFSEFSKKDGNWIYSNSLTDNISSNISKYRNARVEIGKSQNINLTIIYDIDCTDGGYIKKLSSFGPTQSKRQKIKLLNTDVSIDKDFLGNPIYVMKDPVEIGNRKKVVMNWRVKINQTANLTENLGSIKALRIAVKDSDKLQTFVSGDQQYWNTQNEFVKKIAKKSLKYNMIFDVFKFLFEFTNRRITYQINEKRLSPIEALYSKSGDCSEYSDLLVTLLRAAGIPSRVVEGVIIEQDVSYTTEGHAWVEFLTTKGWIFTDPTWGLHLGVTCQHIEFNRQAKFKETSVFEIEFQGVQPKVTYQITWKPV